MQCGTKKDNSQQSPCAVLQVYVGYTELFVCKYTYEVLYDIHAILILYGITSSVCEIFILTGTGSTLYNM